MTAQDRIVLLVSPDVDFTESTLAELTRREPQRAGHYQVPLAATVAAARVRLQALERNGHQAIAVILDDRAAHEPTALAEAVRELAFFAPVIAVVAPERAADLSTAGNLIAVGDLDCVLRVSGFQALLMALVERRAATSACSGATFAPNEEFAEALRHEMNNPLTGILGNAELLLARRDTLTPHAVQRLEIIADLAVRLRETIRRLSNAWEADATTKVNP